MSMVSMAPCSWAIFCSSVMASTSCSARSRGDKDVSSQANVVADKGDLLQRPFSPIPTSRWPSRHPGCEQGGGELRRSRPCTMPSSEHTSLGRVAQLARARRLQRQTGAIFSSGGDQEEQPFVQVTVEYGLSSK